MMRTGRQVLIGLCSVAFLLGGVTMVTPLGSMAEAVGPNPPGQQGGRFVVWGTGEVLDVTTSLRWQQEPGVAGDTVSPCDNGTTCEWEDALDYYTDLGGGYRLPEVKELSSLLDYSQHTPALPAGHPFSGVRSSNYWSASRNAKFPTTNAWFVNFINGLVNTSNETSLLFVWCARSGS